ncbi:hypothetical protein FRC08_011405 [Ceratobasidium sp. 394]|nr:hypothetical protein FRC08_011405 [Ceratobasidium sp. 394]
MATANRRHREYTIEEFESTFHCSICQDDISSNEAVVVGRCGHVHCRNCWNDWLDTRYQKLTHDIHMLLPIICPSCRGATTRSDGRAVDFRAAAVDEDKDIETMLKETDKINTRNEAMKEEMATIKREIKRLNELAAAWKGHIDEIEEVLERMDVTDEARPN